MIDESKLALARTLHNDGTTANVICATLGVSRTSLYRYLAATRTLQPKSTPSSAAKKKKKKKAPPSKTPSKTTKRFTED